SLMPDSAQLRGHPDTASFTLCGLHMPTRSFSRAIPIAVESWVPKRQNSLPTHVLTVRRLLPYACPEGMSRSAHTCGKSSFLTPSRSMRWPPVTFTIGIAYLSATSAMRRSSDGLVTPPHIRGTTEYVPSFWILACMRSLASRD